MSLIHQRYLFIISLPPKPWHAVHIDFCRPFPSGDYNFLLQKLHPQFQVPAIIKSENGLPFTSHEFNSNMIEIGVKHQKIIPL